MSDGKDSKQDGDVKMSDAEVVRGLDADDDNEEVKLVAGRGEGDRACTVSRKAAMAGSVLIRTTLQSSADDKEVPLPGIAIDELRKAVEFMRYCHRVDTDKVPGALRPVAKP